MRIWIVRFVISMMCFSLIGCTGGASQQDTADTDGAPPATVIGNYLGSEYKGNYVWGGAMNLAWTDLKENIVGADISLQTKDKAVIRMVEMFNSSFFGKNDLSASSYYSKSGYGQQTIETIREEMKKKFPDNSLDALTMTLSPTDIVAYAYFAKSLLYNTSFMKTSMSFQGKQVEGFYADDDIQKSNIQIVSYESDDTFIISIRLKQGWRDMGAGDQLIMAKGYDTSSVTEILDAINTIPSDEWNEMDDIDSFIAPTLSFSYRRPYTEFLGLYMQNDGFEKYSIDVMAEQIDFEMNKDGVRVENEAVIMIEKGVGMIPQDRVPKLLVFDKPYRIIMKQKNSTQPYFVLGVNNTELMEVIGNKTESEAAS